MVGMEPSDTLPVPAIVDRYAIERTPLRGRSKREDWHVTTTPPSTAVEAPDLIARLRAFFGEMDAQIDQYRDDPIATAGALARLEALLADVRYVRDRLRDSTAEAMNTQQVRRLTIEHVTTVEASASIDRTNWQHLPLLTAVLSQLAPTFINTLTGENHTPGDLADWVLTYCTPTWKLTPLRDSGIDPDKYCDAKRDDNGRTIAEPTVRIVTNEIRKPR